jgi:hypothetical protein
MDVFLPFPDSFELRPIIGSWALICQYRTSDRSSANPGLHGKKVGENLALDKSLKIL